MKKVLILFFVAVICAGLFFCSRQNQDRRTVIKFSSWGSKSETALLLPLIAQFERENPDIKVEFLHIPQNYFQKLHLLFASNLAPDVVFVNNHYALKYIKAGLLEDLTPYVNRADFFEKALEGFSYEGKIYAVPRDVSVLVVFYNKDLFKKYNVPLPEEGWSFEQYLKTAQKFKTAGVWGTSFEQDVIFWLPYLFSSGASVLSEDGRTLLINNADALEALQFYADLANRYAVAPKKSDSASFTMAQLFLQQKLAMQVSGRWLVPKYRSDAEFDWDIAEFPCGKKGSVVNIDASGYAMSKKSKHKQAALKFIEFISSKDSLETLAKSGLIVPARKDIAYSDVFSDKNEKPVNSTAFLNAVKTGRVTPVNEDYQKLTDSLKILLEPVFLGKITAKQALKNLRLN